MQSPVDCFVGKCLIFQETKFLVLNTHDRLLPCGSLPSTLLAITPCLDCLSNCRVSIYTFYKCIFRRHILDSPTRTSCPDRGAGTSAFVAIREILAKTGRSPAKPGRTSVTNRSSKAHFRILRASMSTVRVSPCLP